jgi:hypothetical protein
LQSLRPGDHVQFEFEEQAQGEYVVRSMKKGH